MKEGGRKQEELFEGSGNGDIDIRGLSVSEMLIVAIGGEE